MRISAFTSSLLIVFAAATAHAQTGTPPPDAEALASGPSGPADAPTIDKPKADSTAVTVSAGGLFTSGNSRTIALTLNGAFDMRRGNNGFGASVLGNYGEAAPSPNDPMVTSAENVQGRIRYDRYFGDSVSIFLIGTGRYDRFQGLAFRLNLDPGVKYIFVKSAKTALWAEAGYDFQYDVRTEAGRRELDGDGNPTGVLLDPTRIDHSARVFAGFRRAFTEDVTFSTGLEYLQSFITTDLGDMNSRFNFNAVLAAKLFKGFSLGLGFNAAYDRLPIPGREQLDTTTTLSLIYGWAQTAEKPKKEEPKCPPCPEAKPGAAPADPKAPATPAAPETPAAPQTPDAAGTTTTTPDAAPATPPATPAPSGGDAATPQPQP
ncbi:MAG: DUF481 domain-containing protein [Polyangiaceae bacterium]|nr:DUF481 domain-containing protein [Polyangiaceae bacterium]